MPDPIEGESRTDFIARCISVVMDEPETTGPDHAVAKCEGMWDQFETAVEAVNTMKINCHVFRVDVAHVRRERHEGREHLVAPVIMMVEGVHCGSMGPSLYLAEEFSITPAIWNGVPLPVFHPEEDGQYVSANDPAIIEAQSVGRLYNVHFDEESKKLKGEIWVDIARAMEIDSTLVPHIESGRPLDVSTAHWSEDDPTTGVWNNEEYIAIVRNIRPDHLALLPGEEGACSWRDGCGVRANTEKEGGDLVDEFAEHLEEVRTTLADEVKAKDQGVLRSLFAKVARKLGLSVREPVVPELSAQEISHDELRGKLQVKVDELDQPSSPTPSVFHYVLDVYDDYLVFEARRENEDPKLFKQGFTIDDQNNVALVGRPEEVIQETEYVAASAQPATNEGSATEVNDDPTTTTETEVINMDRNESVTALITCEQNTFCEDDREFLMGLADDQFTKIEALAATKEESSTEDQEAVAAAAAKAKADAEAEAAVAAAEADAAAEAAPAAATEDPVKTQTLEELVANASPELKESIEAGQKVIRGQKDQLVAGILANKRSKFTEAQLREKGMDELMALAELAQAPVDFSLKIGGEIKEEKTVPDPPAMRWNKDRSPDYSHLDETK